MELGQRIKEARLAAGLSQKALCGDTITRNMLSLIESGKAKPSMDTLKILAERLGKSVSYFLDEDTLRSPNQELMNQARDAFRHHQYKVCLSLLGNYQPGDLFDDEKALLQDESLLRLAEEALADNRIIYAKDLLYRMTFQGMYRAPERKQQQQLLLAQAGENIVLPGDDTLLLLRAKMYIRNGNYEKASALLAAMDKKDSHWQLLQGQTTVALKKYREAIPYLQAAELAFPKAAIPLLERCYRELEDFKNAYVYALKLRGE